ncbi:MCE family protein [Nocardia donostiensis]|uniref:Mammalian cell entry protein n=1 Tax=Nocardia donostiensis TaxID=1538463 RepID=A0A1W0BAG3_9NOCA|nr:MCE family protein [Nocardia donostiensis]ONM49043.1 mammalian cell entry protein [Nocardia donostiensis]OQS14060.1 mammalian cell entry protein [Nocardia donostiensis]OQS19523.1 mammalian cell entry protein [Nocardia donostiensis]
MNLKKPKLKNLQKTAKALFIGATALALGSCTLTSSVDKALGNTIQVTADFENIAGMYEGNTVTVLGLDVGKVDKIVPRGTFVEVHMSLDSSVQIPKDAMAVVISPSIVTNRHIEFTPRYTEGETLEDGDHLPLARTDVPVELETMLQTIDKFAAALKPQEGQEGIGPLSGRVLYPVLNGNGAKLRDTLNALSSALKVGVDNKDAISTIIIKLNELTTMLAENDQSVRDFSNQVTQMTTLLAEQAPGLEATLNQLYGFLNNTSSIFAQHKDQLSDTLTRLDSVIRQLRDNAHGITEVVDVAPLLLQNIDRSMNREHGYIRLHAIIGTSLNGEMLSLFCERIQMRADGCRTGRVEDFGPDFGLTAALLGLTK